MNASTGRGGPGRGQGRKPLDPDARSVTVTIRLTQAQRVKLAALGGAWWIRRVLDDSPMPDTDFTVAKRLDG